MGGTLQGSGCGIFGGGAVAAPSVAVVVLAVVVAVRRPADRHRLVQEQESFQVGNPIPRSCRQSGIVWDAFSGTGPTRSSPKADPIVSK